MPVLANITLEQLRSYTKAQIVNFITTKLNSMTKRKLIMWLWDEIQEIQRVPVRTYRKDGQIESQVEINEDTETGVQTGKRMVDWTYYPTGEVNVITIKTYDGDNVLLHTKAIKHYIDGRQPTATEG